MCVYSMVLDRYQPVFPSVTPWVPDATGTAINPMPTIDWEKMARNIKECCEAEAAAKLIDKLTDQPDCEDEEKKKLLERVEALEAQLVDRSGERGTTALEEVNVIAGMDEVERKKLLEVLRILYA